MVNITGNNLALILQQKGEKQDDPVKYREEKLEILQKLSGKNRIGGLIKGTYQLNLLEAIAIKELFELDSMDEVVNYKLVER